jgi:hypothetical protein
MFVFSLKQGAMKQLILSLLGKGWLWGFERKETYFKPFNSNSKLIKEIFDAEREQIADKVNTLFEGEILYSEPTPDPIIQFLCAWLEVFNRLPQECELEFYPDEFVVVTLKGKTRKSILYYKDLNNPTITKPLKFVIEYIYRTPRNEVGELFASVIYCPF